MQRQTERRVQTHKDNKQLKKTNYAYEPKHRNRYGHAPQDEQNGLRGRHRRRVSLPTTRSCAIIHWFIPSIGGRKFGTERGKTIGEQANQCPACPPDRPTACLSNRYRHNMVYIYLSWTRGLLDDCWVALLAILNTMLQSRGRNGAPNKRRVYDSDTGSREKKTEFKRPRTNDIYFSQYYGTNTSFYWNSTRHVLYH